ncbi:unnamed protein product, partial [Didymodactylos carnosus]
YLRKNELRPIDTNCTVEDVFVKDERFDQNNVMFSPSIRAIEMRLEIIE